jgi:hypothetical protein
MRRFSLIGVIALCVVWAPCVAAQGDAWKIFVRASGTWSSARGVEISSEGAVVTHEGEREEMPRCAQLSPADIEYLGDRIAQIQRSVAQKEQQWPSTAVDNDMASIMIRWLGTDEFRRLRLPLARQLTGGSPPASVLELLERSWKLREAATSPCYARP